MAERAYHPRLWPHALLALLHAGVAALWAAGLWVLGPSLFSSQDDTVVLGLIGLLTIITAGLLYLSAMACTRRLFLLFRHPSLRLSCSGLHVRWYRTGWRTLLKPMFLWAEQDLDWTEFRGCRIDRLEYPEYFPWRKSLILRSDGPEIELTWGMFAPSVERLQREILDYYQLTVLGAGSDGARVPEFLQQLFRKPVTLRCARLGRGEIFLSAIAVPVVGVYFAWHLRDLLGFVRALEVYAVLMTIGLGTAAWVLRRWIQSTRFIELSSVGIAIGPSAECARRISWHDIAFARAHDVAGGQPSSLTRLELRLRDGTSVIIRALPEAAQLAAIVDPPAALVREAWRLMDQGQTASQAALAAGILDHAETAPSVVSEAI